MDTKYKSHSFVKLWIATTIFILCCFTTDMSAQNAAAADTVAAVTETITEVVAAPAEEASAAPDTVGELALGLILYGCCLQQCSYSSCSRDLH